MFPRGLGIYKNLSGDETGNVWKCFFTKEGCNGIGEIKYGVNVGNPNELDKWQGGLKDGKRYGLGHLTWHDGAWHDGAEVYMDNSPDRGPLPGVTILNDGSRFEGLRDNRLNGLGVMWTSEGKVMTIGEWADGKVIVDRNHELYIKSRWFYG